jgi:phosphoenolpyruvate carboxykinase (GTP)
MEFEIKNKKLKSWIKEVADMCQPDDIYVCNGSKEEYNLMMEKLLASGIAIPLKKRPNSYLFRSDPSDVARVEDRTYVSTSSRDEAGPTNNWLDPAELKEIMTKLYKGCMKGRTMYVIPFSMGPIGSPISKIGVLIHAYLNSFRPMESLFPVCIQSGPPWPKGRRMSCGPVPLWRKSISVTFPRKI